MTTALLTPLIADSWRLMAAIPFALGYLIYAIRGYRRHVRGDLTAYGPGFVHSDSRTPGWWIEDTEREGRERRWTLLADSEVEIAGSWDHDSEPISGIKSIRWVNNLSATPPLEAEGDWRLALSPNGRRYREVDGVASFSDDNGLTWTTFGA